MSRLPGGINRATYQWPQVSVTHPEYGAYTMEIHCLRSLRGTSTLMAFTGHTRPNTAERKAMIDLVAEVARGTDSVIEPIDESDISSDVAVRLAAEIHADPAAQMVIMAVERNA
jgi:hypothetical protein